MATKPTLTPEFIVSSAVAYVDQHGIEALTLRSLGAEIGAHHTALYRHFRSKDELFVAMYEHVLADVVSEFIAAPKEPKARIRLTALAIRKALHAHPNLAQIMATTTQYSSSYQLQDLIVEDLRSLGVKEYELVNVYQVLESYVFGTTLYDYADAPNHISERRERFSRSQEQVFRAVAGSEAEIDAHNEKSFGFGLGLLLEAISSKI